MSLWSDISLQISDSINKPFNIIKTLPISGGCINQAYCIEDTNCSFFVKLNKIDSLLMFEAEAAGLQEIQNSNTLRAPTPICWGKNKTSSWLVLEFIEMANTGKDGSVHLGRGLAEMHRKTSKKFGWVKNNTIGSTPQINQLSPDWIQFWRKYRLGYQLQLAKSNGYSRKLLSQGESLMIELDAFFPEPLQTPSLLHGDLWSGNYSYDLEGFPVLYDPAIYYGDREADIAMTELFGGFPSAFLCSI